MLPFAGSDVSLSFLPLSHIFQRMGDYLMFATGSSIAYAESIDTVPVNLVEVRPTIVFSVPRLYEKMYARVLQNALAGGAIKKRIFFWARRVADKWADVKLAGGEPKGLLARKYAIAQKLVFSKLKERTGGRMRFFVSGGAPLAPEINKFFYAAGLTILEGYGLTETSPVIGVNTLTEFQDRHDRQADRRSRGKDCSRRRDPYARPRRDEGLLQQSGGNGRGHRS